MMMLFLSARNPTPKITGPTRGQVMGNNTLPAPVHQLVGQLRELMAKATSAGKGWKAEYCGHDEWRIKAPHPIASACCPDLGCANNVKAIVAVFNALPALLAIAEAAERQDEERPGDTFNDLHEALSALGGCLSNSVLDRSGRPNTETGCDRPQGMIVTDTPT